MSIIPSKMQLMPISCLVKIMINFLYIALFSVVLGVNAFANFENEKCKNLWHEAQKIIEQENVPATAISIVDKEKIICQKFYGTVSQSGKEITADTIFPIASLSKGFLGALLSIMADEKQFNWKKLVSQELKTFRLKNSDYSKKLTFHHIASMQTGLPEFAGKEFIKNANNRSDIIKAIAEVESIYPPGAGKFSYQYGILAVFEELIKKRTGYEWEKLLQKKILDPLSLKNTGTDIADIAGKKDLISLYDENNKTIEWEEFKVKSAAGIYSSLNDLSKWTRLHLRNGNINNRQLISNLEMNKMRNRYSNIENYNLFIEKENYSNFSYGRFWRNYQYKNQKQDFKVIEHTGASSGSASIISYIPSKNLGIIILSNKLTHAPSLIRTKFLQLILEH